MNESMSDRGDCGTAPATPGLLNTREDRSTLFYLWIIEISLSVKKFSDTNQTFD